MLFKLQSSRTETPPKKRMYRHSGRFLCSIAARNVLAPSVGPSFSPIPYRRALGGAVRRRRRPATGRRLDAAGTTTTPTPPLPKEEPKETLLSPTVFAEKASQLLTKIHAAMQPLVPLNAPHMLVTRGTTTTTDDDDDDAVQGDYILLDFGPVHGHYQIQIDTAQQMLVFVSPLSGQRVYYHHTNNNTTEGGGDDTWCCVEDGHNFEGLLVRDLIRHIQGVPQL